MYEVVGKCPLCGGNVYNYPRAYGCGNWKREDGGCKFTIWKNMYGKILSEEDARTLIDGEIIGPYDFQTKESAEFRARLYMSGPEPKLKFDINPDDFKDEDEN